MKSLSERVAVACFAVIACLPAATAVGQRADDPALHSHPLLGASTDVKVRVEWNRLYDHAGLEAILARLHRAFPHLTRLYSIGESVQGRQLWCLEVTSREGGDPDRKPAMYIDGNIHGNEVQGGEAVAYTAWYLLHQYGHLDRVTELLDRRVFYLLPSINPDGRDSWLHDAHTPHSSRTGQRPYDNDRDGELDEDGPNDLNGDGHVTMMRQRDPMGRHRPDQDHPEYLMNRVEADRIGDYVILGQEGIDDDGDGRVNEDGAGGYDPNRDWAWDWQPRFVQYGALEYPFALPESRAVAEFVIAHPNIGAMQSYHNTGGMILRGPGREGGQMGSEDEEVLKFIAARGEEMLPFYRSLVVWKDLYTVWGGEFDWFYGGRGILGFSNELWTNRNLGRTVENPDASGRAPYIEHVLLNDGVVEWEEFDHPTYGKIEIGGTKKQWGRVPASFLLEEECHRNMAFTLYHAEQLPLLEVREVEVERLADRLSRVWVTIDNRRMIPTRTGQDVANHISPPDVISLSGRGVEVLSAGRVPDHHFKRVEPVERRPERVEVDTIPGMGTVRVQFIVSGRGRVEVTVDSAKGGLHRVEATIR